MVLFLSLIHLSTPTSLCKVLSQLIPCIFEFFFSSVSSALRVVVCRILRRFPIFPTSVVHVWCNLFLFSMVRTSEHDGIVTLVILLGEVSVTTDYRWILGPQRPCCEWALWLGPECGPWKLRLNPFWQPAEN